MSEFELELRLNRDDFSNYHVELFFKGADIAAEPCSASVEFDFQALTQSRLEEKEYGQLLTQAVFGDAAVQGLFLQARKAAETSDKALRLRLFVAPSAPELHSLRWELLLDPEDGSFVSLDETIVLSRFLSSLDWRRVPLRPQTELRALVAICNPGNLSENLRLNSEEELDRARQGLGKIKHVALAEPGKATFSNITGQLREGYDILYLVCHGKFRNGQPWLILEDEEGKLSPHLGEDLAQALRDLRQRPRLVVLASCESAGDARSEMELGNSDRQIASHVLAALGPRLARVGIPAVVAMQGPILARTSRDFFAAFFQELQRDGQVDRAAAAARGAVRQAPDWWAPALFTRLTSGRIWYRRGFGDDDQQTKIWEPLLNNIAAKNCTPVLGPALTEYLIGPKDEIASRWAEEYNFPMSPHDRENMAQVAQFLARNFEKKFPRDELVKYVRRCMVQQHGEVLRSNLEERLQKPEQRQELMQKYGAAWRRKRRTEILNEHAELTREQLDQKILEKAEALSISELAEKLVSGLPLDEQISIVAGERIKHDPLEPHRVLADLDLPLYVTTNFANLMSDALKKRAKQAVVGVYPWREKDERGQTIQWPSLRLDKEPDGLDSSMVYHLFGRLDQPETVVLTEDDYFDYLINLDRNNNRLHFYVKRRVTSTGLLFLGFKLDAWSFRVLFRSIMTQEGSKGGLNHLAVQIDPEDGRVLEPELARQYLRKYFGDLKLHIYWGSAQDFLEELKERWESYRSEEFLNAG